jgi:hypothetical protein
MKGPKRPPLDLQVVPFLPYKDGVFIPGKEVAMTQRVRSIGEFIRGAVVTVLIVGAVPLYAFGREMEEVIALSLVTLAVIIMGIEREEPEAEAEKQQRMAA